MVLSLQAVWCLTASWLAGYSQRLLLLLLFWELFDSVGSFGARISPVNNRDIKQNLTATAGPKNNKRILLFVVRARDTLLQ